RSTAVTSDLDLVVRGGVLVDGTGAPARRGDVGVRDGRIVALGEVAARARRTLDAAGLVVAPGFVDVHTHYDAQVFWDRWLTISPWHGVTSVVMGNCGFGIAPTRPEHRDLVLRTLENVEGMSLEALRAGVGSDWPFETFAEFLDAIARRGTAINVGALVGHTPVRLYVMGEEATEREATGAEVDAMRGLVAGALAAGAPRFPPPPPPTPPPPHAPPALRARRAAPPACRPAAASGVRARAGCLGGPGFGVCPAAPGPGLFPAESPALHRRTRRPISWTALLAGMLGPDGHRAVLEQ